MPIDPAKDTFIELERGEQIKIEKDTDHLWRPNPNPTNPVANLTLEGGGRCFYYHPEGGIWYCSEYIGSLARIPEFKNKYRMMETEAREREAARWRWEQEGGGAAAGVGMGMSGGNATTGMPGFPMGPGNVRAAPQNYGMSIPQPGAIPAASTYGPGFPQAAMQGHFPTANTTAHMTRAEFPDHHGPAINAPRIPSFPPSFPLGPGTSPPPPPSFPPSFSFGRDDPAPGMPSFSPSFPWDPNAPASYPPSFSNPPALPGHSSMPTGPPMPPTNAPGGHVVIDGGEYHRVGGRVRNSGMDNSTSIAGHDMGFNWSPDLHQERNGMYNANW